jgi:hypothetical protein
VRRERSAQPPREADRAVWRQLSARLERLEAAEIERSAAGAKIIDAEAVEIEQRGA